MRSISEKRLAKLGGKMPFSSITSRPDAKPKRSARLASEIAPSRKPTKRKSKAERDAKFAHDFGSAERVAWVSRRPCSGCGGGPCENHHITTGGTGRRAHHSLIIPLCKSCHLSWHAQGRHTFCDSRRIVAAVEAETTARDWLAESARLGLTLPQQ